VRRRGRGRRGSGGVSEELRRRHAWLELLQTSGPFLTLPVVHRVFPDGLPPVPIAQRAEVRAAVAGMLDSRGATRHAVIELVLRNVLDWEHHMRLDTEIPDTLAEPVPGHGLLLRPDFGFWAETAGAADEGSDEVVESVPDGEEVADEDAEAVEDGGESDDGEDEDSGAGATGSPWKLLGMYLPWGTNPLTRVTTGGWTASGIERLAVLLRARQVSGRGRHRRPVVGTGMGTSRRDDRGGGVGRRTVQRGPDVPARPGRAAQPVPVPVGRTRRHVARVVHREPGAW
jgi:hypothetical protein